MKKKEKPFYKKLLTTIILDLSLFLVLLGVFQIINRQLYNIDAKDGCKTAFQIQKIIRKLEPKSVLFSDFGSDSAHYLKEYILGTTHQYEDVRSITGDYNESNQVIDRERKNNYEEQLLFDVRGMDMIVLFCSEKDFNFCNDITKKIQNPIKIILVKTSPLVNLDYDSRGYARCLVK